MKIPIRVNKKILIASGIGVLVVLFAGRFLFFELGKRFKQLNGQLRVAEAQFNKATEISKAKDDILTEIDKYQPYLKIEKMDKRQVIEALLKEIESIAKETEISTVNLSPQETPGETKEEKGYKADLRAEGNLVQVINFFSKVQESKLLIKFDKVSLIPKDEAATVLKLEATISVVSPRMLKK